MAYVAEGLGQWSGMSWCMGLDELLNKDELDIDELLSQDGLGLDELLADDESEIDE